MFVLDVKMQYMFVFLLQNTLYCISFVDKKKQYDKFLFLSKHCNIKQWTEDHHVTKYTERESRSSSEVSGYSVDLQKIIQDLKQAEKLMNWKIISSSTWWQQADALF